MRRLYVGGLSHLVTQKDLTDRFGKFGNVEDVELRTRLDDEGAPYKTFAYINLNISDTDLKKCMTVLNKSKWKGGTLQIEPAKQSLLHKLAQERQEEEEEKEQRSRRDADNKHQNACKLLESLSQAGVDNFTMKAAVPGTEIPGHKDWVVSKFGRVLPVMQLRCQKGSKARTVKYDPSKYCHNIRRLAPPTSAADPPTPVARLTWQIAGGDDDISKKRRGEFPPYQPPKKARTDAVKSTEGGNNGSPARVVVTAEPENHHPSNGFLLASDQRRERRARGRYEGNDSDEEIRQLVALERSSHNAPGQDVQDDNLEVVGDDYLVKSGGSWWKSGGRPANADDEDDYDSADTDELFASRKNPLPARKNISTERTGAGKRKRKQDDGTKKMAALSKEDEEEEDSTDMEEISISGKPSLPPQDISEERMGTVKRKNEEMSKKTTVLSEEDEESSDEESSDEESSDVEEISSSRKPSLPPQGNFSEERMEKEKRKHEERTKKTAVLSEEEEESDDDDEEEEGSTDTEEISVPRKPPQENIAEERMGTVKRKNEEMTKKTTVLSEEDEESSDEESSDEESSDEESSDEESSDVEEISSSRKPSLLPQGNFSEERMEKEERTKKTAVLSEEEEESDDDDDDDEEEEEGSTDTEEISIPRKPSVSPQENIAEERMEKVKRKNEEMTKKTAVLSEEDEESSDEESSDEEEISSSRKSWLPPQEYISEERTGKTKKKSEEEDRRTKKPTVPPEEDEGAEEADSDDSNYEAFFSNVTHLEISLADLRKLAEESQQTSDNPQVPPGRVPKKGTLPEDILASLLEDDSSEDERECRKKTKVARATIPAFRGTATLYEDVVTEAPGNKTADVSSSSSSSEARRPRLSAREEADRQRKDNSRRLAAVQQRLKEAEEHKKLIQGALANVDAVTTKTGKHIVFDSDDEQTTLAASKTSPLRDNQSEDEEETAAAAANEKERARASGPRLFDGSEDEEGGDEEEDDGRFHIRPQFEGQAGQKLMDLQSRFGTDQRFQMDSRFLDEDDKDHNQDVSEEKTSVAEDEDLLQEEKKRNMSIVQDLLGHQANSGKTSAKAKTFRDVSALHYDPSREEHSAFESKAENNKDSKSARRKKREEAQKLPEVSKDIFYDVSGDLKAMFRPAADQQTADRPKTSWDQEDEEEEEEEDEEDDDEEQPTADEHPGFMFSFFGDEVQTAREHEEYKVESVQAAKMLPWQQDSSEEEEDDDEAEAPEEESDAAPKNATAQTLSSTSNFFFFFHLDDSRLTEGPEWFCRSSELEDEREEWEERRTELRQEYRKKHKDARRKLKSSQKI
ncbi:nucleolar protein 8 isoform X2 [Vanacampus margaritifer]